MPSFDADAVCAGETFLHPTGLLIKAKSWSLSKTSLEDFLVNLYVKIDGKVWEQESQFNLIKKSLLDNVLHRRGEMPPEKRRSLGEAMIKCHDAEALRAAVARYVDVGSASRKLRFRHQNDELVATDLAGNEAFRVPCPPAGKLCWKVSDFEKFLVSQKLIAGTYVVFIQDQRADANAVIEDMSRVTIKEVVAECPSARTDPDSDERRKTSNCVAPERGGIAIGSAFVMYKGAHVDWPLSRDEKKSRIMGLYDRELRAAASQLPPGDTAPHAHRESPAPREHAIAEQQRAQERAARELAEEGTRQAAEAQEAKSTNPVASVLAFRIRRPLRETCAGMVAKLRASVAAHPQSFVAVLLPLLAALWRFRRLRRRPMTSR